MTILESKGRRTETSYLVPGTHEKQTSFSYSG